MIVYEVNLRVERDIAADYLHWLRAHVAQMLALPGFEAAALFETGDTDDPLHVQFCVQYRLRDEAALEHYLRAHAPRLRADGMQRFGARFSAKRRVLRPIAIENL